MLVTQSKSKIGQKKSVVAALRTLGLGKIGRTCVVSPSRRSSDWGNVRKVAHLVTISPLFDSIPPGRFTYRRGATGVTTLHEQRQLGGSLGELIALGEGEYVQTDFEKDRKSVFWSSDMPADECLSELRDIAAKSLIEIGKAETYIELSEKSETKGSSTGSLNDVLDYLEQNKADPAIITVSIFGMQIMWNLPAARLAEHNVEHAEIGLTYPREPATVEAYEFRSLILDKFFTRSASKDLSESASEVLSQLNRHL
ncbi:50S ribosomal protein L30 [Rhodococcoides fascians A25f]|nr:50S ribosomal protein L30 [Rhodococcus fascians A25f]